MSFDRVAPFYCTLERLVFGDQLQQARLAFVNELPEPRRVLIVGEGDGRFLAEFVRLHPGAEIDCVEASARMIALARARLGPGAEVNFIQGDLREASLATNRYDLIVSHFFLDCFAGAGLGEVVQKLARAGNEKVIWLLADFHLPKSGWRRGHAHTWLRAMYLFFRLTSGLEAQRLENPAPLLRANGFACGREREFHCGMIRSAIWHRLADRAARGKPLLPRKSSPPCRG